MFKLRFPFSRLRYVKYRMLGYNSQYLLSLDYSIHNIEFILLFPPSTESIKLSTMFYQESNYKHKSES